MRLALGEQEKKRGKVRGSEGKVRVSGVRYTDTLVVDACFYFTSYLEEDHFPARYEIRRVLEGNQEKLAWVPIANILCHPSLSEGAM